MPIAVPVRPLGIVVPAPKVPQEMTPTPPAPQLPSYKKDSVEILLDGMLEQGDRTRTARQSDGQASAAYHASHAVHPSERASDPNVPKVLLDRPLTPTMIKPRASPPPPADTSRGAMNATVMPPARLGTRILVAALLGLLVGALVFIVLELTDRTPLTAAAKANSVVATAIASPTPSTAAVPHAAGSAVAAAPSSSPAAAFEPAVASAPSTSPALPARAPAVPAAMASGAPSATTRRHAKASASSTPPDSSADFGEFRTNF
jgi:hypothetical protein